MEVLHLFVLAGVAVRRCGERDDQCEMNKWLSLEDLRECSSDHALFVEVCKVPFQTNAEKYCLYFKISFCNFIVQ